MSSEIILKSPDELRPHPNADLIPPMRATEYEDLLADIREHGIQTPLDIHNNVVLDGRHRLAVAKVIGLDEVPTRQVDLGSESAMTYMLKMAVLRRHLNDDQRAALAAMWKRECARPRGRPQKKDHDAVE